MSFPAESEPENELLDCTLLPLGNRQLLVDGATVLRHLDPVNLGEKIIKKLILITSNFLPTYSVKDILHIHSNVVH
jgi:hypothetical protein